MITSRVSMTLAKKFASFILSLFFIVSLTFFMMKAIPGDPFTDEKALPEKIHRALRAHYGLDDPWYQQYGRYLKSAATFDFGPSFKYKNRSVNAIIADGFPVSALLGLEALAIALLVGVSAGSLAALGRGRAEDIAFMGGTTLSIAIPSFILAALLQYVFALKLGLFPLARWGTFAHTVLPALSLAAMPAAFIARLVRANLLDVLRQDYIKTARIKGLPMRLVIWRHGLTNALSPLLPYLAQLTANIMTGSFVIEKIFGIPGLGAAFVQSVQNRDYTVIMGVTIFYSMILLSLLLAADLLYRYLDPRLQEEG